MSNARKLSTINKLSNDAYLRLVTAVDRMGGPGCGVRPFAADTVFVKTVDDSSIKLVVKPVALRLKEKANTPRADMLVVVSGQVNFSVDAERLSPLSCFFKTEVGYFRKHGRKADHVFGVHYDNDLDTLGHPIFHAQFKSFHELLETANTLLNESLELDKDEMKGIAGRVRVPTAHMDPFSVFLQLIADHLVNENSDEGQQAVFEDARQALSFFRSDPARSVRLEEARRLNCFRGSHWYPLPGDNGNREAERAEA